MNLVIDRLYGIFQARDGDRYEQQCAEQPETECDPHGHGVVMQQRIVL
jgi:hypothetical protein